MIPVSVGCNKKKSSKQNETQTFFSYRYLFQDKVGEATNHYK